jgi:hypothetical protein
MTVLGVVTAFVMNQKVDWRDVASKRIEDSPRAANLSPEQKEQQLAMSAKVSPYVAYVFGTLGPIGAVVIVAAVMLLAYNLIGGASAKFGTAMGIVSHAMAVGLLGTLFFILILFLKPAGTIDIEKSGGHEHRSISAGEHAQSADGSRKIDRYFQHLDVAADLDRIRGVNPKKLTGKALSIALSVWAVYVACKMGAAWIFS